MVTSDDIRAIARELPRAYEAVLRDRVKWRVGRIVFAALSRDETVLGFGFPRDERATALAAEPELFLPPAKSDERYQWLNARMSELDQDRLRELIVDAWAMCVPKFVSREWFETHT
ncbi:MAG TPA: MmcQ/YjbR family DNA-binding protein [Jatrophihabitantaceae bacterium]|nr:MmcQ/YjbR family DNA-binding protein [Jatrophihabitantaceae bacterium]